MTLEILNGSMQLDIYFDKSDREYDDNICVCIKEACPEDEKIMYATETNIYLTSDQARTLAEMLQKAADQSNHASR
jgi:hypothetical protein